MEEFAYRGRKSVFEWVTGCLNKSDAHCVWSWFALVFLCFQHNTLPWHGRARPMKWSGWFFPQEKWRNKGILSGMLYFCLSVFFLLFPLSLAFSPQITLFVACSVDKYKKKAAVPLQVRINKFDILNGLGRVNKFYKGSGFGTALYLMFLPFTRVPSPLPAVD